MEADVVVNADVVAGSAILTAFMDTCDEVTVAKFEKANTTLMTFAMNCQKDRDRKTARAMFEGTIIWVIDAHMEKMKYHYKNEIVHPGMVRLLQYKSHISNAIRYGLKITSQTTISQLISKVNSENSKKRLKQAQPSEAEKEQAKIEKKHLDNMNSSNVAWQVRFQMKRIMELVHKKRSPKFVNEVDSILGQCISSLSKIGETEYVDSQEQNQSAA